MFPPTQATPVGVGAKRVRRAVEARRVAFAFVESTRIDKWLCAVRVYKSRSLATAACEGGHVAVNDRAVKASTPVRIGDRVVARVEHDDRILEVARIIDKRVGASVAAECFVDHTPKVEREPYAPTFAREAGAGRPTKRDRRDLDRLRR